MTTPKCEPENSQWNRDGVGGVGARRRPDVETPGAGPGGSKCRGGRPGPAAGHRQAGTGEAQLVAAGPVLLAQASPDHIWILANCASDSDITVLPDITAQ